MNKPLDAELWPTTFQFNRQIICSGKRSQLKVPKKWKVYPKTPASPAYHAAYRLKQREAWLVAGIVKPRTDAERAIVEGL